jgi:hypothetical protein
VGILDNDGKCTVCGTHDADAIAPPAMVPLEDAASDEVDIAPDAAEVDASASGFDPGRRLCSDGSCIGVLGQDDRCSVCGLPRSLDI